MDEESAFIDDLVKDDEDGKPYLDYLRVAQSDLEPQEHVRFLQAHHDLITTRLKTCGADPKIGPKYECMRRKHNDAIVDLPDEYLEHTARHGQGSP